MAKKNGTAVIENPILVLPVNAPAEELGAPAGEIIEAPAGEAPVSIIEAPESPVEAPAEPLGESLNEGTNEAPEAPAGTDSTVIDFPAIDFSAAPGSFGWMLGRTAMANGLQDVSATLLAFREAQEKRTALEKEITETMFRLQTRLTSAIDQQKVAVKPLRESLTAAIAMSTSLYVEVPAWAPVALAKFSAMMPTSSASATPRIRSTSAGTNPQRASVPRSYGLTFDMEFVTKTGKNGSLKTAGTGKWPYQLLKDCGGRSENGVPSMDELKVTFAALTGVKWGEWTLGTNIPWEAPNGTKFTKFVVTQEAPPAAQAPVITSAAMPSSPPTPAA